MTLHQILKDSFNMKDAEYQDDKTLMDLADWDSMNHMIFITRLEEVFSIELNGNEVISLVTIGDVKALLDKKGVKEVA
jgi:acyl carrier protein